MRKKFLLIIIELIIIQLTFAIKLTTVEANTNPNYTTEQKAIREVANAYYMKGINMQYDGWRLSQIYPPEEATSQRTTYSCCTNYTYSIFYQAFGIDGGYLNSNRMIAYGMKYYDPNNTQTNDVVEYWQKKSNGTYEDNKGNIREIDLSTANGRRAYVAYMLNECHLQVGDVICYHKGGSGSGHGVIVYDIIYDDNGNPIDAIIRESTSKSDTLTNKTTKGLCYTNYQNDNNNIHEGTHREAYLVNQYKSRLDSNSTRHSVVYNFQNSNYFVILRTLLKDENGKYTGKFYNPTFKYDSSMPTKFLCTGRTLEEYRITDVTLQRIKYSNIDIEKTVDVYNSSVVNLGDTLEYTIKITNNSDNAYNDFDVVEKIPEFVEVIDGNNGTINGNIIKWKISNIGSKQTREIKYKVKVKENIEYLGKEIISTGTVAGIPSATVKNLISKNLTAEEKDSIRNKLQEIINANKIQNYSGEKLISSIYNNTYNVNLNLDKLDITDLIQVVDEKEDKNYDINSYHDEDGDSYYNKPTVYINNNNPFSKMIMYNYYNALKTRQNGNVYLRYWENLRSKKISRSDRADNINKENFQTGDILIYKNTQTPTGEQTYPSEDGLYYFVYIDQEDKIIIDNNDVFGFIGIDNNGNLKYVTQDYINMRSLIAKDYYVVLRPSITNDITPMKVKVEYNSSDYTSDIVEVTVKSNEEILPVSGWTLSEDKKNITKSYSKNIIEHLKLYDYGGNEKDVEFEIDTIISGYDKNISKATISGIKEVVYTGKPINQNIKISMAGIRLEEGIDYKLLYSNNTNTGKATVKIIGIGKFEGEISKNFIIKPSKPQNLISNNQEETSIDIKWDKNKGNVSGYKVYIYNQNKDKYDYLGKTTKNNYTIKNLSKGTKYKFKVKAYKIIDNVKYSGSKSDYVRTATKTKATKIKSIKKNGNKKVKIKWENIKQASGYEVQYSTRSNFLKNSKKIKIMKNTTTSKKINGLKNNKKYYFRIRTYVDVNGKKIFSKWSQTKSYKIKTKS